MCTQAHAKTLAVIPKADNAEGIFREFATFELTREWTPSPCRTSSCYSCYKLIPFIQVAAATAKSLQSCPTLCDPIDGSPPGSPVPGILQARTLEWVLQCMKVKSESEGAQSCQTLSDPMVTVAHQAPPSMGFSR